jgi:hypothetical protein
VAWKYKLKLSELTNQSACCAKPLNQLIEPSDWNDLVALGGHFVTATVTYSNLLIILP